MSCLGDRLADLVDGRLSDQTTELVLAHAVRCDRCRAELTSLRSVRAMLAGAAAPSADADLVGRLALLPVTAPLPVYRGAPELPADGPGAVRHRHGLTKSAAAVAGGAAAVVVALAWAGVGTGAVNTVTPVPQVVPPVDRYTVEHVASTDRMPLVAPGSGVTQVSYGSPVRTQQTVVRAPRHPAP